jgi:hypothetical protein
MMGREAAAKLDKMAGLAACWFGGHFNHVAVVRT